MLPNEPSRPTERRFLLLSEGASDCTPLRSESDHATSSTIRETGERIAGVNALTLFGLFAVTAMLVTYALENRSPWFILAFAASCALGSVYGFLQGAWPFGVVEAIWAGVAVRRWHRATHPISDR